MKTVSKSNKLEVKKSVVLSLNTSSNAWIIPTATILEF